MNPLIGLPIFILLVGVQSVLGHLLAPFPGPRPMLVPLAVISCGLLYGPRSGALWGAVGGVGLDLASAGPLGAATLPAIAVGFLSGFGHLAALRVHRFLPLELAAVGAVGYGLLHMLLLLLSGWDFNWIVAIYEVVLPSALVSLPLMPLVYGLLYWVRRRRVKPRLEPGW